MTWYWPLLPLLVSSPASAFACTPLPLHTSVTPGLAPQGSGYLSVKQAELLSRAPGHCPIERGCQCGGRQWSPPSFYISRRRKEPESHPRKPIWGCSLVRFSQPGWQASGRLGSRFYLNLTHLSLTFWARWTTQEHNIFQPWGSTSGKLSASQGSFSLLPPMFSHQAFHGLYEHDVVTMALYTSYMSSYFHSSSFIQAMSHGVPGCQLLGANHAGASWARSAGSRDFWLEASSLPPTGCNQHWYMPSLWGVLPPKLAENAAGSAHLLSSCPENLKMVYCCHQSAFLHSRSSCEVVWLPGPSTWGSGYRHWLSSSGGSNTRPPNHQPPVLPSSILPSLSL